MRILLASCLALAWAHPALAQDPVPVAPPPLLGAPMALEAPPIFKIEAFPKAFVPVPGAHRVIFFHPITKKPTEVMFDLPAGKPKVTAEKRTLKFDYGKKEVIVRFYRDGGFRVAYD